MKREELENYLHQHIPLSRAMEVSVVSLGKGTVSLRAPLAPNINHRATVFGGSASAVAILASWALLHARVSRAGIKARLVIQRNTMEYALPITGEFTAQATLVEPSDWEKFVAILSRRGKARISVTSVMEHDGQVVGRFMGEFVALRRDEP